MGTAHVGVSVTSLRSPCSATDVDSESSPGMKKNSTGANASVESEESVPPSAKLLSPSKWCVGDEASDKAILTAHLAELRERNQELSSKKAKNDEYIKKLHMYNEIKDTTQEVFGKIAERQCCRTRDVYAQYDLDVNA